MNNDYLSKPKNSNGCGIVVIHEFWGVNGQIKKMTDEISSQGYAAIAADLYEGIVARDAEEAKKMKEAVKEEKALMRIREAMDTLNDSGITDEKIAVWGFCFGGSYAFKSAAADIGAGAYVIYYGGMITDDTEILTKIQKPVLGIFGGLDKSIPAEKVGSMKKNLEDLGKTAEIYIYPDAEHAFANDERPSFNKAATDDAWHKTMAFLQKHLTK